MALYCYNCFHLQIWILQAKLAFCLISLSSEKEIHMHLKQGCGRKSVFQKEIGCTPLAGGRGRGWWQCVESVSSLPIHPCLHIQLWFHWDCSLQSQVWMTSLLPKPSDLIGLNSGFWLLTSVGFFLTSHHFLPHPSPHPVALHEDIKVA